MLTHPSPQRLRAPSVLHACPFREPRKPFAPLAPGATDLVRPSRPSTPLLSIPCNLATRVCDALSATPNHASPTRPSLSRPPPPPQPSHQGLRCAICYPNPRLPHSPLPLPPSSAPAHPAPAATAPTPRYSPAMPSCCSTARATCRTELRLNCGGCQEGAGSGQRW